MPQVGAHITIADLVAQRLGNPAFIRDNREAFRLGSIGPDMTLFLFDPVGTSPLFDTAISTLTTIREVAEFFGEIAGKALGPAEDFADWVTGGLSTSVVELVSLSMSALVKTVEMQVLPGSTIYIDNPFAGMNIPGVANGPRIEVHSSDLALAFLSFGHPYTSAPPYKQSEHPGDYTNWWWIDLLHYRRTGFFGKRLLDNAATDLEKAYAHGYMTHIAGDVCGHPYVNAVVGGPYRNHVLRHMVMEKVMDTWVWNHYKNQDLVNAQLDKQVDIGGDFGKIADLLIKSMQEIYTAPLGGRRAIRPGSFTNGVPERARLEAAYDSLLMYLELSTGSALVPPVPPPGSPQEFFEEIGDSIGSTAQSIGESFSTDNEWWEWLLAPFLAAAYGLVLLFKLATLPAEVLTRVLTLAPRWYAYYLQVALYDYIRNMRWVLVLSGWGLPSRDDLTREFATLCYHIPAQRTGTGAFTYPYAPVPITEQAFWLRDPMLFGSGLEADLRTESCPYPKASTPDIFVDALEYNAIRDRELKDMAGPLRLPVQTVKLEKATFSGNQFGSAAQFAVMLLRNDYPVTSFDLDADKGYGFLSWEGMAPSNTATYRPPSGERLHD